MSRVNPPERLDRPSERPEHPPVWVRGGPASYYYSPNKPPVATADEAARRASSASTLSKTSTNTSATDPTTTATTTTTPRSPSFPFTSQTTPPLPTMPAQTGAAGRSLANTSQSTSSRTGSGTGFFSGLFSSGDEPMSHPAAGRGGSPSSSGGGRPAFSGLRSQKRESGDPTYVQRRESWREQTFRPNEGRRFVGKWWDSVIRGDREAK